MIGWVKPSGWQIPALSSTAATAGQESRSGQYPVDSLEISVTMRPAPSTAELDLAGAEHVLAVGAGDVFAAPRRDAQDPADGDH
jgi:hypothetical protein